jgi:hypothetical protein
MGFWWWVKVRARLMYTIITSATTKREFEQFVCSLHGNTKISDVSHYCYFYIVIVCAKEYRRRSTCSPSKIVVVPKNINFLCLLKWQKKINLRVARHRTKTSKIKNYRKIARWTIRTPSKTEMNPDTLCGTEHFYLKAQYLRILNIATLVNILLDSLTYYILEQLDFKIFKWQL